MWDERYSTEEYVYGTNPNDFLVSVADRIPAGGRVLSLGEGEGRNCVFLAGKGFRVTAVDQSEVGLGKALNLAREKGVEIGIVVRDLAHYRIEKDCWDGIISFFCHLPPQVRREVFTRAVEGLRPGGVFILEAFSPEQLNYDTGGPRSRELLMPIGELREELAGLDFLIAEQTEREVLEGRHHKGTAAVVRILGRKP